MKKKIFVSAQVRSAQNAAAKEKAEWTMEKQSVGVNNFLYAVRPIGLCRPSTLLYKASLPQY